MSHFLNKNVIYNGKSYPKGSPIKSGDEGFEALVKDGHAVPAMAQAVAVEPEGKPEQPAKPEGKSKK